MVTSKVSYSLISEGNSLFLFGDVTFTFAFVFLSDVIIARFGLRPHLVLELLLIKTKISENKTSMNYTVSSLVTVPSVQYRNLHIIRAD